MQVQSINHAVDLQDTEKCPQCNVPLSDALSKRANLILTQCGHVYDQACLEKMQQNASARKIACLCSKCSKPITYSAELCKNLWQNCVYHGCQVDEKGILESLDRGYQMMITNCGHLIHALCWIDMMDENLGKGKFGFCSICQLNIYAMKSFVLRPNYKIKDDVDDAIKEFLSDGLTISVNKKAISKEDIEDEVDAFETI